HYHPKLACQNDLLTTAAERLAQHLLRCAAPAVNVGGVEQRNPFVERSMHHGSRLFRIDTHAEVVASQSGQCDLKAGASHIAILHNSPLAIRSLRRRRQGAMAKSTILNIVTIDEARIFEFDLA